MSNFEVHAPRVTRVMVGSNHVRNGNSDGVSAEPFSLSGLLASLSFSAAFHFLFPILGVSLKKNVSCHHIHSPAVSHTIKPRRVLIQAWDIAPGCIGASLEVYFSYQS